jgi:hypothetical protein
MWKNDFFDYNNARMIPDNTRPITHMIPERDGKIDRMDSGHKPGLTAPDLISFFKRAKVGYKRLKSK